MPNYFQIGTVVFDEKIFYILSLYRKSWPHPLTAMFFSTDQYDLNNLGRGSLENHLCSYFQNASSV